jgi:hypothetical protein
VNTGEHQLFELRRHDQAIALARGGAPISTGACARWIATLAKFKVCARAREMVNISKEQQPEIVSASKRKCVTLKYCTWCGRRSGR